MCGIGIKFKKVSKWLQTPYSPAIFHLKYLLENYLLALEKFPKWKQVFSEYEIEFELSRMFSVHIESYQKSLCGRDFMCKDGSIITRRQEGCLVYDERSH